MRSLEDLFYQSAEIRAVGVSTKHTCMATVQEGSIFGALKGKRRTRVRNWDLFISNSHFFCNIQDSSDPRAPWCLFSSVSINHKCFWLVHLYISPDHALTTRVSVFLLVRGHLQLATFQNLFVSTLRSSCLYDSGVCLEDKIQPRNQLRREVKETVATKHKCRHPSDSSAKTRLEVSKIR